MRQILQGVVILSPILMLMLSYTSKLPKK